MSEHRRYLLPITFICLFLLAFTAACGDNGTSQNILTPTITQSSASGTPTRSTPTLTSVAQDTACPAPGSGRPAVMPALQPGTRPQIIYYHNIDAQMVLDIFDVQRQAVVAIIGENEHIQTAQLSDDGQWVLMVASNNTISELQLVRVDGKFFQTLYCAPAGQQIDPSNSTGTQWSPDQKQIIFTQGTNAHAPLPLYLLNVASGHAQLELTPGLSVDVNPTTDFLPVTWVDNTRVYVVDTEPNFDSLAILDTRKGPGQHASDLQEIVGSRQVMARSFDSNYDATRLFISEVFGTGSTATHGVSISCSIDVMPINQANFNHPLSCKNLVTLGIRVIGYSGSSLMLDVNASAGTGKSVPTDGFWKINTDGSGLKQLNTVPGGFNRFTQYPWSNFSRDGSLYTDGLFYGSLNGGSLIRYAADGQGDGNVLVGWTTL
ncbi:MAG TPA: hypothetical protein VKR06_19795 [Ktedonosporobacter sp.]|nr:hypothetical protein [Ktedonosporobacter sp.]